jgi:small subunit ribosomal protein S2
MSIGIQELLEAGVHFGHQTRRWNPKMKPYIFQAHNGVHIIDLAQTVEQLKAACTFLGKTIRGGGKVLFVGTKRQAQPLIREIAVDNNQHYVTDRWLGGMLTNLKTVKKRLKRLLEIEAMEEEGSIASYVKQEQASIRREKARLIKNLGGIRKMDSTPDAIFIVDLRREHNAVAEARKLHIPIVAIVDTNCDPEIIDYPIVGNDDAIKSIQVIVGVIGEAVAQASGEFAARTSQAEAEAVASAAAEAPTGTEPPAAEPAPAVAAKPAPAEAAEPAPTVTSEPAPAEAPAEEANPAEAQA